MKFVLDNEDDDDVVVDVGAGSFDDVDSICVFLVMVKWHLLPSCLLYCCNIFYGRDCCCCYVVVVVVVVFVFVVVHNRCHLVA